jgi:hypothetical protein
MTEAMVSLEEIATATGRRPAEVKAEARALNLTVRPDWMNRPSLTVADARGLTTGEARRNLEHDRAWAQHQRDTKAWVEGRSRAIAEAAKAVRATTGTRGGREGQLRGAGSVSLKARAAAVEAGVQWEKRNPRPAFGDGVYSVHLEYIEEVPA